MRQALKNAAMVLALCAPCGTAPHLSWNKIAYVGGTVAAQPSKYDWNITLAITYKPDLITLTFAPSTVFGSQQVLHIKPSQVISLSAGEAAWRHIGEVDGAKLPAKQPTLFGLLQRNGGYFGLVYQTEDGKRAAMLFESIYAFPILQALQNLTGKALEASP